MLNLFVSMVAAGAWCRLPQLGRGKNTKWTFSGSLKLLVTGGRTAVRVGLVTRQHQALALLSYYNHNQTKHLDT